MTTLSFADCCFLSIPKDGYRLTWEVTQHCPYSCEYCFTWSSPKKLLFEEDIISIIKNLQILINKVKVRDVLITGGEPLCTIKEISPFLSFLNSTGVSFSFSSNLHKEALFEKLSKFKPRAINLSIDPPSDRRSKSSFKAAYDDIEKKLKMVEKKGMPVKLTAVINRSNYRGVQILLDRLSVILSKYSFISKIAFNREYPIGYAAEYEPQTKNDLKETYKSIENWAERITTPITLSNWDIFHAPLQSCPAGKNLISLMPNADITPCSLLYNLTKSFRIGNLIKDKIDDIIERLNIFSKEIVKYNELTKKKTHECSKCNVVDTCGGGCPAMLPIASNHISRRTCKFAPKRIADHERKVLFNVHQSFHTGYSPELKGFVSPKEGLPYDIEKKIRKFVNQRLEPSDLAHTVEHIDCVVALAKTISEKEGASLKITVPAAYFHDICPREPAMHHMHTFKSAVTAKKFLKQLDLFSEDELIHIQYCIYTSSYGSYLLGYLPLSLEAKVVRDADWLDAIGARGIARVFAFGQAHGAETCGYVDIDPEEFVISMDMNITGPDKDPITHFFTKLLRIYLLLQTPTGRKIGSERHQFMIDFLNRYREEMNVGKNNNQQLKLKFNKNNSIYTK